MKRSLTLLELSMAVVIIFVLATLGIPMYRNIVENAKAKVCETNLKMLQAAVEAYGLENNVLPGTLTQLRDSHIQRAWAHILKKENRIVLQLAYMLVDFDRQDVVFAQGQPHFLAKYMSGDLQYVTCPADKTPPPSGHSYGLNKELASISYREYKRIKNSDVALVVIGDSEEPLFDSESSLSERHAQIGFLGSTIQYSQVALSGKVKEPRAKFRGGNFWKWGQENRYESRPARFYPAHQMRFDRDSGNHWWKRDTD